MIGTVQVSQVSTSRDRDGRPFRDEDGMLTITNTDLLNGLRNPDNAEIWEAFFERYQPLLVSFGRRLGLNDPDAQDGAQEALMGFVRAYREGAYDRAKGRLRSWLFGIASNKMRDIQRKRGRDLVIVDEADDTRFLNKIPDDHSISEVWEAEWRKAVLSTCLREVREKVKPKTMKAFELFALEGLPAQKVAEQLEMTENAVWIAKNRVLSHMREIQQELEESF
jgi:RNA polymerase sigma-70 factor (ECF subfamily)